jgi:hypothetical protein
MVKNRAMAAGKIESFMAEHLIPPRLFHQARRTSPHSQALDSNGNSPPQCKEQVFDPVEPGD